MGQSAVSFRSNWQNNNPKLWVLVSKTKYHILWAADLHVCQMSSPCWTGSVHFDPELEGSSFGFGLQLALNFLYFQRPQYSVRKSGNFWIMEKTFGDEMIYRDWMLESQSHQWLKRSQAGVMRAEFETWACHGGWALCCRELLLCGKAGSLEHLLGELHANGYSGKVRWWLIRVMCYLGSLPLKFLTMLHGECWNTTRWPWGIFSAVPFHCLRCYFGRLLCESVHFANKKYFLQNWAPGIEA